MTFSATPDVRVLAATLGFAGLSTIAFGLGPALRLSRRDLVADLKDRSAEGASTGRRFGARNLMVIGQVALSLAMLTAGGIFARTALTAAAGNPGYWYDRLLLASVDAGLAGFDEARGRAVYRSLLDRVRSTPGVATVSMTSTLPFGDTQQSSMMERVGGSSRNPFARARIESSVPITLPRSACGWFGAASSRPPRKNQPQRRASRSSTKRWRPSSSAARIRSAN